MRHREPRDYLDMSTHSIMAFANDGRLDHVEFDQIMAIALRDNVVDDNEKRVLGNIISRLTPAEMTPEMQLRVGNVRAAYGI